MAPIFAARFYSRYKVRRRMNRTIKALLVCYIYLLSEILRREVWKKSGLDCCRLITSLPPGVEGCWSRNLAKIRIIDERHFSLVQPSFTFLGKVISPQRTYLSCNNNNTTHRSLYIATKGQLLARHVLYAV